MIYDMYDEDLPEVTLSWADQFKSSEGAVWLFVKIVGIPTALFAATCVANYFINKKVESL